MTTFTDKLHEATFHIWQASHQHPFLTELRDGTLAAERFAFYMKQDYAYLKEYAKMFAYGSIKAKDLDTMGLFAKLLDSTLNVEMELHRQYAERLGIPRQELEDTKPASVTTAYTSYLLNAAAAGNLAELTAALLPCTWSYCEIGTAIAAHPGALEHPFYGEWVEMYASPEFAKLNEWCMELMNQLAEGLPEGELAVLTERFVTASRFEYLFWEMAYRMEEWPV
jgi:thiaminase (transcriptional activator TenA)